MSDFLSIATAPGDLPPSEIARRYETIHHQLRHENTIQPAIPRPGVPVVIRAASGAGAAIQDAVVRYTTDGSLPEPGSAEARFARAGTDWLPFGGYIALWEATIPAQPAGTVVRYRITGTDAEGRSVQAQDGQGFWFRYPPGQSVTTFAYRVSAGPRVPEWFRNAVVYQVFVDRFRRPGGFQNTDDLQAKHGGSLAGIEESLPYLRELGVNCIWLSPVNPAPSYHRYNATDLFSVDPVLGDVDTMKSLTKAAHDRGMRVVLDFVPSHLSRDHESFAAARRDRNAETADWFYFYEWPDRYRSFLELVPSLVSINTESGSAREFLIRSAKFWAECGIDGFRLDHVIGHGMDFWVEFQKAIEEVRADVVTFGEATDTGDALRRYQGRLDGILDFPLARALRLTFATGDWSVTELDGFLEVYEEYMAEAPLRVSFLDNHDMDRFLYVADQDRDALLLGLLCLLTLPGVPVIYYGTEIGMTQEISTSDRKRGGDALARQDMIWDKEHWDRDLRRRTIEFVRIRHDYGMACRTTRRRLHVCSSAGTYAYELSGLSGGKRLAVLFNTGREAHTVSLPGATEVVAATRDGWSLARDEVVLPARTGLVVTME